MNKGTLLTNTVTLMVAIVCAASSAAANLKVGTCDQDVPWLKRDTAALVLRHIDNLDSMLSGLTSDSPVLLIQLSLWADVLGFPDAYKYTEHFDADELLGLNSNSVTSVLWLLSYAPSEDIGLQINKKDRSDVRKWAHTTMPHYPVRQMDLVMVKAGLFGGAAFPLSVLQSAESDISDPSILFHIAGELEEKQEYEEAHSALVKSIENGLTKSFLGLGLLEAQHFKECAERAKVYIEVFEALWSQKE